MEIFALTVCIILSSSAEAGRRRFHKRIGMERNEYNVFMSTGTPPQAYSARLDTRTAHLIIMDAECHDRHTSGKCKPFCLDPTQRTLLCNPMCEAVGPNVRWVRCGINKKYNASKSTTFVERAVGVYADFQNMRPFFGRRAEDAIGIVTDRYRKVQSRYSKPDAFITAMAKSKVGFVRGLAFDQRYLNGYCAGAVGLAPLSHDGRPSLFPELTAAGYLDSGRISIQKTLNVFSLLEYRMPVNTLLIGAFDQWACRNWRLLPSRNPYDWTFDMADVSLYGISVQGPNIGRISLDQPQIGIPKALADRLTSTGEFYFDGISPSLRIKSADRRRIRLEFTVGKERISLGPNQITHGAHSAYTRMISNGEWRFVDEAQWTFGTLMLESMCVGYDYDLETVALAEKREMKLLWNR